MTRSPLARRRAALAVAGVVTTFSVLALAGPALAAPAATTITVTFFGTPSTTGPTVCPSKPDTGQLTIPPGTTVNFANELGKPATLWAGDSHKHLGDDQMVPVTFTTGSTLVTVQMLPDCALDLGEHDSVTVNVTTATPSRTPGPGQSTPAGTRSGAAGGGASDDDPFITHAPATPVTADTSGQLQIAEPVPSAPAPHGASGLLTLIATVCIVGVTVAALRAIVAQRATRTFSR